MKIAVIDPSLFTWPYDRELAGGLHQLGHDVRLFGKALPATDVRSRDPLLSLLFYPQLTAADTWPTALKRVAKGLSHFNSLARLRRELSVWGADVIHFQWLPLPIVDALFLPSLRRIAPLVLTVHDTLPFNGSPRSSIQTAGAFSAFRHFDHLIVHTDQGRQRIAPLAAAGLSRVPHGLLHDGPTVAIPARVADETNERVTLLMFGQIKPYKGVDVLLEAVAKLGPAARARIRICIAGKPHMDMRPLRSLAARLGVEQAVEFHLEFIPDPELRRLIDEAHAVLFPYREIEASGALMAAIAQAKPVIASRLGSFAELLEDGRHALLVPPDNSTALAQAIERFVSDAALRQHLRRGVMELKAAIPTWSDIATQTVAVYEQAGRRWQQMAAARPVRLRV
jgi:glycosyltransferase involved in cell wall biosynthesis